MTATEQLKRYRSRHRIMPSEVMPFFNTAAAITGYLVCATDYIRVHPRYGPKFKQGWIHDRDEIKRLVKASL